MSNKKHFQISQQDAEKLAVRFGTPLLVLSLDEIKKNYKVLKKYGRLYNQLEQKIK